jgi:hypothetical protein
MQREDADVEREPNESEPGEDYYDAIRESGTEVTELLRVHAFRRRGIHQVRRLWVTLVVWMTVLSILAIIILVRDSRTWYYDKHEIRLEIWILVGVCVFLIASCVLPYFWRRRRERLHESDPDS